MKDYDTDLYFESHITIEPVFGEMREKAEEAIKDAKFRMADLVMKKGVGQTETPNQEDSFCTGRGSDFNELMYRTQLAGQALKNLGIKVYRYKLENTLIDTKIANTPDVLNLLG